MNVATVVVTAALGVAQAMPPAQGEPVWWWFSTCGGPTMTAEVTVEGITVAQVSMPVCRAPRNSPGAQGGAGTIDFSFRPRRRIVWTNYRDELDRTAAGQLVQGSLWQAGADPDALLIGVSFSTADRGLMNTIHVAHPGRRDRSTIAPGLIVVTYPSIR